MAIKKASNARWIYPALAFILLYYLVIVITRLYYSAHGVYLTNINSFQFATSPFNFLEDFSKVYPTPVVGAYLNVVYVLVILLVGGFYATFLRKRLKDKVGFVTIFLLSVLASYLTYLYDWISTGTPGIGSSIIALDVTVFILLSLIVDLYATLKDRKNDAHPRGRVYYSLIVILYILFIILFAYLSQIYLIPFRQVHELGLLIFLLLLGLYLLARLG